MIDCAVPVPVEDEKHLLRYLPERWRRHLERFGTRAPAAVGRTAARGQLGTHVELGVLAPMTEAAVQNNLELAAAMAAAVNDWQIAEWLEKEPRLRASIVVAPEEAALAVAEIERRAADRRFVQVVLPGLAHAPFGDRRYGAILAAAERHGLPICIADAEPHLISLVLNGVFEQLPKLRVLSVGSGCGWLPPLLWRLDGSWKVLKDEVPELRRLPSEYLRDRVWLDVASVEIPHLPRIVEQLGYDDRLVAVGEGLPPRVARDNALALYADRI